MRSHHEIARSTGKVMCMKLRICADSQGGNVPVGVGNDWVVHQAVRGVCLNVLDPPARQMLQGAGYCLGLDILCMVTRYPMRASCQLYMGAKIWHIPLVGDDIVATEGQELRTTFGKLSLQLAHFSCVSRANVWRHPG
jgi:hypothetical protein